MSVFLSDLDQAFLGLIDGIPERFYKQRSDFKEKKSADKIDQHVKLFKTSHLG